MNNLHDTEKNCWLLKLLWSRFQMLFWLKHLICLMWVNGNILTALPLRQQKKYYKMMSSIANEFIYIEWNIRCWSLSCQILGNMLFFQLTTSFFLFFWLKRSFRIQAGYSRNINKWNFHINLGSIIKAFGDGPKATFRHTLLPSINSSINSFNVIHLNESFQQTTMQRI